jgi:hypothetical protein
MDALSHARQNIPPRLLGVIQQPKHEPRQILGKRLLPMEQAPATLIAKSQLCKNVGKTEASGLG